MDVRHCFSHPRRKDPPSPGHFDPDTGALLGAESDPHPPVPEVPPVPPTYTVWLESAYVPAIGDRP